MNRTIRFWTIALTLYLFICITVQAATITFPLPISGHVNSKYQDGLKVTVTNQRTNQVMTTLTSGGYYLIDWANSYSDGTFAKYSGGDVFIIKLECSDAACEKRVAYSGQVELLANFDVSAINPCPAAPGGSGFDFVSALLGAGALAFIGIAGYFGKKKFTKEEKKALETEISGVLSLGSGVQFYKNAVSGLTTIKHQHKGISGYHDPITAHKDPAVKHDSGKIFV